MAHGVKGVLLAYHSPRDIAAGETELRRAIELNPRLANPHRELGVLLLRSAGRVEEALDKGLTADELEPFWFLVQGHLIESYLAKGDLVGAAQTAGEARELGDRVWGSPSPPGSTWPFRTTKKPRG